MDNQTDHFPGHSLSFFRQSLPIHGLGCSCPVCHPAWLPGGMTWIFISPGLKLGSPKSLPGYIPLAGPG